MVEAIAVTLEEAIDVEKGGANRIELVSALSEGGLTPSYGLIKAVCGAVKIPVNVMIRPHSNAFSYSDEEIRIMKNDIEIAKSLGANGVVLGVLNSKKQICTQSLEELLEVCDGLDVTFHRAIDELENPVDGVHILSKYSKITTILTSGGKGIITNNLNVINEMKKNSSHIDILVGGGLSMDNIENIANFVSTNNFHFGTGIRFGSLLSNGIDVSRLKELTNNINNNWGK